MKRFAIALLLAAGCFFMVPSCHKHDYPHKKDCQIKKIEVNYRNAKQVYAYSYNSKRLLDSISITTTNGQHQPYGVKISYNGQGLPIGGRKTPGSANKLVYENGRVVRVDELGSDNLYHTLYTYTYDAQGRVIELVGQGTLRYEYEGTSANFTRKTELYSRPGDDRLEVFAVHKYQYDNKLNPWNTWPDTKLNPLYLDFVLNTISSYEPIPENNMTLHATQHSFRGILYPSNEINYTYTYDDVYPVTQNMVRIEFNIFTNRNDTTTGTTYYTYDCNGKGKSF